MGKFNFLIFSIVVLLICTNVNAALVQWRIEDGGNGHWYDIISTSLSWQNAKADAENQYFMGVQGHLATLTSEQENSFVIKNLPIYDQWIGGYQTSTDVEPNGNWAWITGEEWSYTNWARGEPSNRNGSEHFLQFYGGRGGEWNDFWGWMQRDYVVEFDVVPIPGAIWMLGSGLFGFVVLRRKLKK